MQAKYFIFTVIIYLALTQIVSIENLSEEEKSKESYGKYFKEKRLQHHLAIKRIIELKDGKKQFEMLKPVVNKLFEVMYSTIEKLAKVQSENRDPDAIKLDEQIANDISILLENTAFIADITLHFPKILHKLYAKNPNWKVVLESSIQIAKKSNLLDEQTLQAIYLMSQELNITPKSPNYHNPYKTDKRKDVQEPVVEVPKKKKDKRARGPGLSGGKKSEL